MSFEKRNKAQEARRWMRTSRDYAREAEKVFKDIGDKEGERKAGSVGDAAEEVIEHVEKKLGKENN